MNKQILPLFFLFTILLASSADLHAQSIRLLGGNTVNGALNGTMMGAATMAIDDTDDFAYVRTGLGAGTLYGMAVGVYDLTQISKGDQYYISGTFNDGDNSTIIVLLDTFYGAATGSVIAASITLITNEHITEGLQYGAGFGAWAGFAFGLADAFILAEGPGDFQAASASHTSSAPGLLTIEGSDSRYSLGFLNPGLLSFRTADRDEIGIRQSLSIDLLNFKFRL